jgi:Tfp pilus assembly protein PilX
MRILGPNRKHESGSVLLVVLCIAIVLGIVAMGYMYLVSTQHRLVARSQSWNTALNVAEAGIEDGMAQLNVSFGTNYTPSALTNWTLTGAIYGPRSNTIPIGSYSAIIITTNPFPTIISTGYTAVPFTDRSIKRVIRVDTTNQPMFPTAMAVVTMVDLKGNSLTVDSYDSSDPNHSTNGIYNPATRLAGGDVATVGGLIDVQNANIYGKLLTGPSASYSIGAGGQVGDLNWVSGVEPGWYENDFNMPIRDVSPPYTTGVAPGPGTGTNTYIINSGDYYVNADFVIQNNQTLYVAGNARLYVTGNFTMKAQNGSFITIAPGASLKLYVGSPTGTAVTAQLAQVNPGGTASSFQLYGLPTLTTISWSGNGSYMGTVYAPEANLTAGGGGSAIYDFQGSVVCNTVSMNGHFNFHYDENLRRNGPPIGYVVAAWREL